MTREKRLEIAYRLIRAIVYFIPAIAVAIGIFLVVFPVEDYKYSFDQPGLSKLKPEENQEANKITFGIFPMQNHRFIDLGLNFQSSENASCPGKNLVVSVQKTYQAFLFPEGEPITSEDELRDLLFFENKTNYSNGSLLHLKPTDEVYLISDGKKILFPGPEIFRAFGYSFDNLTEVDKSSLDQFPDADNKVFLWTQPHPSGTIFQGFPSHDFYLIADGRKRRLEKADLLRDVWPDFRAIAVDDNDIKEPFSCDAKRNNLSNDSMTCRFDSQALTPSIGRYYYFSIEFPPGCNIHDAPIQEASVDFIAEKSYATAKDSLRVIFASLLNRYIYKRTI